MVKKVDPQNEAIRLAAMYALVNVHSGQVSRMYKGDELQAIAEVVDDVAGLVSEREWDTSDTEDNGLRRSALQMTDQRVTDKKLHVRERHGEKPKAPIVALMADVEKKKRQGGGNSNRNES